MTETTVTPDTPPQTGAESRTHFSKAVEEAKAGARAFKDETRARTDEAKAKYTQTRDDWTAKSRARTGEAKDTAYTYAVDGKHKASEAMTGAARKIEENASMIDEKLGVKYGDYARSTAAAINDAGLKLDEKSIEELGEDAKQFIREKPAMAVGIAAAAGFAIARLFKGR